MRSCLKLKQTFDRHAETLISNELALQTGKDCFLVLDYISF
jgi:hypothetical protein